MSRVATCPSCGDVLVMTFAWRGSEFVCLGCSALLGYMDPEPADETPDLTESMAARKAEWAEMSEGLLAGGAMLRDCADAGGDCRRGRPHLLHATPEELAAHEAAKARIGERLGLVPS
jgi:hypothetical protein